MNPVAAPIPVLMKKLCLIALLLLPFAVPAQDEPAAPDIFEEDAQSDSPDYFRYVDSAAWQPVIARKVPDSVIKRFRNDADFWYANRSLPRKKIEEPSFFMNLIRQPWFRSLMWVIICVGFGSVLIWFLATSNIRVFRKPDVPIRSFKDEVNTENIFSIDYNAEIQKALRQGAYRQAIRLHYLQVLSLLAARDLIRYQQDATNSDYLFQLSGTRYYKPFFMVTRHFEYTWYGQFEVTPAVYAAMEKDFHSFQKEMPI